MGQSLLSEQTAVQYASKFWRWRLLSRIKQCYNSDPDLCFINGTHYYYPSRVQRMWGTSRIQTTNHKRFRHSFEHLLVDGDAMLTSTPAYSDCFMVLNDAMEFNLYYTWAEFCGSLNDERWIRDTKNIPKASRQLCLEYWSGKWRVTVGGVASKRPATGVGAALSTTCWHYSHVLPDAVFPAGARPRARPRDSSSSSLWWWSKRQRPN